MRQLYKQVLDKVSPYIPGKPISEVKRELGLKDVVKLASNENPLGPSKKVVSAIVKAAKDVHRYPDGSCHELRKVLSDKIGIPGENIVFGNGSDELIVLILRAFLEAGDEVIISKPTFLVYSIASTVEGACIRFVPMKDFKYDIDGMLSCINERTKIVFIANPDNPTGSYVTKKELDRFLANVPQHVIVVMDEAYYEFAVGGDYPETFPFIKEANKNVVILRTFSKIYAMAGLRVGYAIARKDLAVAMDKVREPFNINSIAQAAGIAALGDGQYLKKATALVRTEKKRYCDFLKKLKIQFIPSRTNFILINTERDSTKIFEFLLRKGVVVRNMNSWGINGYIRVTFGLKKENDKFFKAFKEALKEIPRVECNDEI
ncbi:MAG TPA: histidinol-phosphate transaminase [Candidatus Omnitrophota bacterium]|nr:histidinol-phosphate transaminase [Candidatus Omnitrophota bacterium]HPS19876.1 histidinol-phosphate transaminase [Candidatus Omnitrophota bacterium]